MRVLRCFRGRSGTLSGVRIGAAGLALSLGACADTHPSHEPDWNIGPAHVAARAAPGARIETEGDGLPAQIPPPKERSIVPDDPREPFSPNYGPPVAPARAAATPRSAIGT